MPKFIKTNTIVEVSKHGIETDRQVRFTDDEVVSRVLLNPSLVIEVTESHAAQVVRPQQKYQELSSDILEQIEDQRDSGTVSVTVPDEVVEDDEDDDGEVVVTEAEAEEDEAEVPLTFGKKGK